MNHLLLKNEFMIPKERSVIYRSNTLFRLSFEREFDSCGLIHEENINRIKLIQPDLDKIDSYPILMLDEPMPCKLHPKILENRSIDPDLPWTQYLAIPICVFFGNYFIWIYLTQDEYEKEIVFQKTNEIYYIPQVGDLCRLVKKSIKPDIGEKCKFDINVDSKYCIPLFETQEDVWEYHMGSKSSRTIGLRKTLPDFSQLNFFNQEFTILQFGKPFFMPYNVDSLETSEKGGTYMQPIQVLSVNPEAIGWIALTVSRARYCMEKIA